MLNRRHFIGTATLGAFGLPLLARATETPLPALPYALFDTHAHLVSNDLRRYPRVASVPGGTTELPPDVPIPEVEELLHWMDASNVAGGVAVQRRGTYGFNNFYVLDSADRFRSRFSPVTVLDATDEATPELIHQYVRERGLSGVRLMGGLGADGSLAWLNSTAAMRTWAAAEQHSLAMAIMTSPPGKVPAAITEYMRLAREFPNVRLVLDHMAWPDAHGAPDFGLDAAFRNLTLFRNIYFKFTSLFMTQLATARVSAPDLLRHWVDQFGADRVMWGSDVGNSPGTYAQLVHNGVAATALLNADEQRKVLRDTGMRVFVRGGLRRG